MLLAGWFPLELVSETELTCSVSIREKISDQHLWKVEGESKMDREKATLSHRSPRAYTAHQTCPALGQMTWPLSSCLHLHWCVTLGEAIPERPDSWRLLADSSPDSWNNEFCFAGRPGHLVLCPSLCKGSVNVGEMGYSSGFEPPTVSVTIITVQRLLSFHPCSSFLLCNALKPCTTLHFSISLRNHTKIFFPEASISDLQTPLPSCPITARPAAWELQLQKVLLWLSGL